MYGTILLLNQINLLKENRGNMKRIYGIILLVLLLVLSGCKSSVQQTEKECPYLTGDAHFWAEIYGFDSGIAGLDIAASNDEQTLTYHLVAEDGAFLYNNGTDNLHLKEYVLKSGEAIGWMPYYKEGVSVRYWDGTSTYIEARIYKEDALVGYGLFRISVNEKGYYSMNRIKCVTFSNGKAEFAPVTEEEVSQQIALAKNEAK